MNKNYLLLAGGIDKKGIVYRLTNLLKEYEFNIEDSSMVMLRRTFSIIMLLTNKEEFDESNFQRDICGFMNKNQMVVEIRQITKNEMKEYEQEGNTYLISLSGADKPGIVKSITEVLYEDKINIIDLETKSSENVNPHAYFMHLEVDIPKSVNIMNLKKKLTRICKKLKIHYSIMPLEKEIL